MAKTQAATAESLAKVNGILGSYKASGLTRREYCQREGISLSMLDYYRRRQRQLGGQQNRARPEPEAPAQRLLRVEVSKSAPKTTISQGTRREPGVFTLTISKGRTIESGWDYREQDLL